MNTILFNQVSVVSVNIKRDDKTGEAYLINLRVADPKYRSRAEAEKAKKEGKETSNFFTINVWKPEIQRFNNFHLNEGTKLEDVVPGTRLKISGHLVNNNYVSNGVTVYKDVINCENVEILRFPKGKSEEEGQGGNATTPNQSQESKAPENTEAPQQPQQEVETPQEPDTCEQPEDNAQDYPGDEGVGGIPDNPFAGLSSNDDEEDDLPF
jgi:single-stranded DNA-binding protein